MELEIVQETDTKIAMLGLGIALVSDSMQRLARDGVVYREIGDLVLGAPLVGIHGPKASPRALALLDCME